MVITRSVKSSDSVQFIDTPNFLNLNFFLTNCNMFSFMKKFTLIVSTTFMPRNAFQANRKEEVLHSGRVGPLSPSGKQAENTVSALHKGEE